jgi:hypothetical protein
MKINTVVVCKANETLHSSAPCMTSNDFHSLEKLSLDNQYGFRNILIEIDLRLGI